MSCIVRTWRGSKSILVCACAVLIFGLADCTYGFQVREMFRQMLDDLNFDEEVYSGENQELKDLPEAEMLREVLKK